MEIKVISGDITLAESDAIILGYYEDSTGPEGGLKTIDEALGETVTRLVKRGEIKGKFKEITLIYTLGKLPADKVVVLGLGKRAELTPEKIRAAVAELCRVLRRKNTESLSSVALGKGVGGISVEALGQAITEGSLLGTYTFRRHITKAPDGKEIKALNIMTGDARRVPDLARGCNQGKIIAAAVNTVRDIVNEPANVMTPAAMADAAGRLARKHDLNIKVIDREEMRSLGMGGLLGVARGSRQPPKFIVMSYQGKGPDGIDIALVGKGITFDSGGISLKPSENMGDMKGDMSGGAAVLGAIGAVAQLKPEINVTAIVPAAENLPGGSAIRPGDILTIMNGKTVEIVTTDAEGRLILADALSYAVKIGARKIVDVATLTGACRIALGDFCTGIFGNDRELINRTIAAGAEAGERLWQLPLHDEYKESNKSDVADMKNSGGRYGGAVTAAWFLREFAGTVPWVHLDIAGTCMTDKDRGYQVKGATGVPARTLINLALTMAKDRL